MKKITYKMLIAGGFLLTTLLTAAPAGARTNVTGTNLQGPDLIEQNMGAQVGAWENKIKNEELEYPLQPEGRVNEERPADPVLKSRMQSIEALSGGKTSASLQYIKAN